MTVLAVAPGSVVVRAVLDSVEDVLGPAAPQKVADVVISRVSVQVPRLMTEWPRADECLQQKSMDAPRTPPVAPPQLDPQVTDSVCLGRQPATSCPSSADTTHRTEAADLVQALVADDCSPLLGHRTSRTRA